VFTPFFKKEWREKTTGRTDIKWQEGVMEGRARPTPSCPLYLVAGFAGAGAVQTRSAITGLREKAPRQIKEPPDK
jgi:hypothetical protein